MRKLFVVVMMTIVAMSVNASSNEQKKSTEPGNTTTLLAFYNKNANVESRTIFYLYAIDRYNAMHNNSMTQRMEVYEAGLRSASIKQDEQQMKDWCDAIEKHFPEAITNAAATLQE